MEKTNIKHSKFIGSKPKQRVLVQSLTLLMPVTILSSSLATTFEVNNPTDDGTGLVSGTLSAAILAANLNPGPDEIILTTDLQFTGVMKRLIDSDVTISGEGVRKIIDGNNQFRPLFIKSGQVMINNIELTHGGGIGLDGGAGLGGSVFIYDGTVTIQSSHINNSMVTTAVSGSGNSGGGMFGAAYGLGGGGLFASSISNAGAYGGYGNYQNDDKFGQGGTYIFENNSSVRHGGFGAGGAFGYGEYAGLAGNGGFGGAGGHANADEGYKTFAGHGGFGGSAGRASYGGIHGQPGYGVISGRYGAAMGGAVFIRSGDVTINTTTFVQNQAYGSQNSMGLGGAIFVLHTTQNSNTNHQGMPAELASVTVCSLSFSDNQASSDSGSMNNNDDIFDLSNRINNQGLCQFELIFEDGFD
jgi:hypothetical protein